MQDLRIAVWVLCVSMVLMIFAVLVLNDRVSSLEDKHVKIRYSINKIDIEKKQRQMKIRAQAEAEFQRVQHEVSALEWDTEIEVGRSLSKAIQKYVEHNSRMDSLFRSGDKND